MIKSKSQKAFCYGKLTEEGSAQGTKDDRRKMKIDCHSKASAKSTQDIQDMLKDLLCKTIIKERIEAEKEIVWDTPVSG